MPLNSTAMMLAANALRSALAYGQLHSDVAGANGTANVTTAGRQPIPWTLPDTNGSLTLLHQMNFAGGAPGSTLYSITLWDAPTPLVAPTMGATSTSGTGGTLPAATYYYKLTATNSHGETIAGSEVSKTTTGTTSTVTIPWTAVTGATGYKLYRSTTTGTEIFLTSISGGSTVTYTDTGSITPSGAAPPSADTTKGTFYGEFPIMQGDLAFDGAGNYAFTLLDLTGSAT